MLKNFFLQAIALPDEKLIVIRYEVEKNVYGKIVLSNDLKLFTKKRETEIKKHLKFIEDYAKEIYFINRSD